MFQRTTGAAAAVAALALALGLAAEPAGAADGGAGAGGTAPAAGASAAPLSPAARALALAVALQQGNVKRADLSSSLNALLSDDTLASYQRALADFGTPTRAALRGSYPEDSDTRYTYRIYYPNGVADLTFAIDNGTGKISVLYLRG